MNRRTKVLGLLALIAISLVLRPAVAVIGPLLAEITDSLALSPTDASVLTAAPVLCFGLGAFFSPWLVSRFGVDRAMMLVLLVLAIAMALRGFLGFPGLLVGTVAAGLSIAAANVLLPSVVRRDFPKSVPLVTGMYTTVLAISASFAASSAVSVSGALGGWQAASAIWAAPGLLAIVLWAPKLTRGRNDSIAPIAHLGQVNSLPLHSGLAWLLVLFFGIQSLGFYAILGWLPTALLSKGFTDGDVSCYLGIATSIGIPFGLAMSSILGRFKSLAWWASGSSAVSAAGFAGLATSLASSNADELILLLSSILIGIGQASTFPISLSLVSIRASSSSATTQLSAMTQGIGYLISALGTFVVGVLATATGSWAFSLWLLTVLTVLQMVCGYIAGKPGVVQDNKKPRVK